ncbi:ankyrin repeat domain-containing protein [Wolbachia endosymbiont (group E) of Neria commutata]|uniref:ankyrin repeat domain-containing protein n=1 Tax=Wolbachia endosymbiont (group E) of Neria commutata TaxID=3066149 RepID=UPI003132B4F1
MPRGLQKLTIAGNNSLHFACWNGDFEIVRLFLEHQRTLNSVDDEFKGLVGIQNSEGDTALHYATRNGHLEIAEYLLSSGADHTIQNNKKETPLDCLLKKHEPQELLDLAIQKGFLKLAELSIDAGADVNLINRDEKFTSPLSEAVENNNLAVVQSLVGRGANIRFTASKDSNMVSMLHLAASNCNLEMMEFFIGKGLDVNETSPPAKQREASC